MTEWAEWVKRFKESKRCIYPMYEFSHRVACSMPATHKSKDALPVCEKHTGYPVRDGWRGYVAGA